MFLSLNRLFFRRWVGLPLWDYFSSRAQQSLWFAGIRARNTWCGTRVWRNWVPRLVHLDCGAISASVKCTKVMNRLFVRKYDMCIFSVDLYKQMYMNMVFISCLCRNAFRLATIERVDLVLVWWVFICMLCKCYYTVSPIKYTLGCVIFLWLYHPLQVIWVVSLALSLDQHNVTEASLMDTGIISCARPANERRRYNVTSSLIGWAHARNDPWGYG